MIEAIHNLYHTCNRYDIKPPKFIVFEDDREYSRFVAQVMLELYAEAKIQHDYSPAIQLYGIHFPHPRAVKMLGGVK